MHCQISVIIPTYNPEIQRLKQVLDALSNQNLHLKDWEIILVDNNSEFNFYNQIETRWHPNFKIIREARQGLTYARLRGFKEARGEILVLVDDDNILDTNYLKTCKNIFSDYSNIGIIGGKVLPVFESSPPDWLINFHSNLALRDFGDQQEIMKWEGRYPKKSPVGAGMAIRRKALKPYMSKIENFHTKILDRTANCLSSGGDNDIVIEIMKTGWESAYIPILILKHLIPKERTTIKYVSKLVNNTNKSWAILLEQHQINPWKRISSWSLPLRKIKSWFMYKAWLNPTNYIKWRGSCGLYDGLAN